MGKEGEEWEYLCNLGHWDFRLDDSSASSSSSFCESDVLPDLSSLLSSPSPLHINLTLASHFSYHHPSLCPVKLQRRSCARTSGEWRTEAPLQCFFFSACMSGHKQGQWVPVIGERADKTLPRTTLPYLESQLEEGLSHKASAAHCLSPEGNSLAESESAFEHKH